MSSDLVPRTQQNFFLIEQRTPNPVADRQGARKVKEVKRDVAIAAVKQQGLKGLTSMAMQNTLDLVELRRSLAKDDPLITDYLREFEQEYVTTAKRINREAVTDNWLRP